MTRADLLTTPDRGYSPEASFYGTLPAAVRLPFVDPHRAPAVQGWDRESHSLAMQGVSKLKASRLGPSSYELRTTG